jgi:glycosyltransferase involved in cell wall biosynthesis
MRLCAAITGVSTGVVREITLQRPKLANKIMVTPIGINMEEFFSCLKLKGPSLRDELNIGRGEKLLACVGRLAYQKGQDILIKTIGFLKAKKIQTKLILVGQDYWDGHLQRLVSNLKLEKEIVFLGRRNDIARILADIDIYVVPSRWEGLSFALCEAMLCAKPCIATMIPWHSELLMDNETAITVPVDNKEKLAEAIIWMLDHPQEAIRMANNAKKLVEKKYTAKKMAESYEQLYLSLINNVG